MYHFFHKHRYWLIALVVISVIAIFYFQMRGDPGGPGLPLQQQPPVGP
jgi:hypothetical protein